MKNEKEIKNIAEQIVKIEKNSRINIIDEQILTQQIEEILSNLSYEEIFQIDDYITKNNLLTK